MPAVFRLWFPDEVTQTTVWSPSLDPVYQGVGRPHSGSAIVHEMRDNTVFVYGSDTPFFRHRVAFRMLPLADVQAFDRFWAVARLRTFKLTSQVVAQFHGAGVYVLVRPEKQMLQSDIDWKSEGQGLFKTEMAFREVVA